MSPRRRSSSKKSRKRSGFWLWSAGILLLVLTAGGFYLLYLSRAVAEQFDSVRYRAAASVYARAHELVVDAAINVEELQGEFTALGYQNIDAVQAPGEYHVAGDRYEWQQRAFVRTPAQHVMMIVEGHSIAQLQLDGKNVERLMLEPVRLGRLQPQGEVDREPVQLSQVPQVLIDALLATEDRQFFQHHGISWRGIARAAWHNVAAGETEQGGSTLTQQLVKNRFLTPERTLTRKLKEMLIALILEAHYDKPVLLEAYLNEIWLGQDGDRAIHGVGLASYYFFGKPVYELNAAQCALMVAMVRGPAFYSPWHHGDRARERRDTVLSLMQQQNYLSAEAAQKWQKSPLQILPQPSRLSVRAPALIDVVQREWQSRVSTQAPGDDVSIYTSIDPITQSHAEAALSETLQQLDKSGVLQGAMVVTDRHSGVLRALVAGRDASASGFNRALDARRPVGSSLKPMIYYSALKKPEAFSLASPLQDSPFTLHVDNNKDWQPSNYDGVAHGIVPLHQALAHSWNLATAHLALEVGLDNIANDLQSMGLQREIKLYPSLALGALELSPLQLAGLYSGFASGGNVYPVQVLQHVVDAQNHDINLPEAPSVVLDTRAVFLTNTLLREVINKGTGRALSVQFPETGLAGKTGTTNDNRDSWFSGFDDEHLIVVWLGYDDNRKGDFTGAQGAMKIFGEFLRRKGAQTLRLEMPPSVHFASLSLQTGQPVPDDCAKVEWLPVASEIPLQDCPQSPGQEELNEE